MRTLVCGACLASLAAASSVAQTTTRQLELEKAKALAGPEFSYLYQDRCEPSPQAFDLSQPPNAGKPVEPMQVTENLFYVGGSEIASWAIKTSQGVIVLDTLDSADEAKGMIVSGLQKLGIPPSGIRYVVVMHGHGDHLGGAAYLQNTFGAQVWMSVADWQTAPKDRVNQLFKIVMPRHDHDIADGETLKLGKTELTFYQTPGHTPGTVSTIFSTTIKGRKHVVGFWGGTGYPKDGRALSQYTTSLRRFTALADEHGVDMVISNHAKTDQSVAHIDGMRRTPAAPNPFVLGPQGALRMFKVLQDARRSAARARSPADRWGGGRPAPVTDIGFRPQSDLRQAAHAGTVTVGQESSAGTATQ